MSLFLPSNLGPNFEEILVGDSSQENIITFSFLVNTNGSLIRSYKIEILNELNDEEDPDDNILYTEYGIFGSPLYNKDFGHIYLDLNKIVEDNNTTTLSDIIVPEKDYRWRVRLYEDEIVDVDDFGFETININSIYGSTYIGSGNIVGTTKLTIWLDGYNDQIIEKDYVRTILYSSDESNDYNPFNIKKTGVNKQVCRVYPNITDDMCVNEFTVQMDHILPDYYDKLLDGNTYMSLCEYSGIQYKYDNETLYVFGQGAMPSYSSTKSPWDSYKPFIKHVKICDGITTVGNYAFNGYTNLETVTLGSDIKSINASAFKGCSSLTSINIDESLVTTIGSSAFAGCTSLIQITIPDSVIELNNYVFSGCVNLSIINITDNIFNMGVGVFLDTAYYRGSENWDNSGVLYVGNHLVDSKTSISDGYTVRTDTKTISGNAFEDCKSLTIITIPNSVTSIGSGAFRNCTSLETVIFAGSSNLQMINSSAFDDCAALESIDIPGSIVDIKDNAFGSCEKLATITIGAADHIVKISRTAFSTTKKYTDWLNNNSSDILYIPDNTGKNRYLIKAKASIDFIEIDDNTIAIASSACDGCSGLTTIEIPENVISIYDKAFNACTTLNSVTIGAGVQFIGLQVFNGCSNLNAIHITNLLSWCSISYESGASNPLYRGYTSSRQLVLNDGTVVEELSCEDSISISDFAFYGYDQLKTIKLSNVISIGKSSFLNCDELRQVEIDEGLQSMGDSAFSGCIALRSVNIKTLDDLVNVGANCFKGVSMSCFDRSLYKNGAVILNNIVAVTKDLDREQYTPKLIESLGRASVYGHSKDVKFIIPSEQAYRKDFVQKCCYVDENGHWCCNIDLVYIERLQVYTIDKSVGHMQLCKLTLDEPLEYNTFHNTSIDIKLKNNLFTRNRLYINSVKEFDSTLYTNAYINLAYYEEQLIDTESEYFLITNKPSDWDTGYALYYIKSVLSEQGSNWTTIFNTYYISNGNGGYVKNTSNIFNNNITYYQIKPVSVNYELVTVQPSDWDTSYVNFYVKTDNGYTLNTDTTWSNNKYYRSIIPQWSNNTYCKYKMSNIDISKYSESAGVLLIINYVSDTGECKLFSDLPFLPDQFYMYLIFVVDKDAPNYNAANTENPYKFFAGVGYDGYSITGVYDDGLLVFREDEGPVHACYLGGGYGITTETNNRFESSYKSNIFSNHQLDADNPNLYLCFILPNLGIKPDEYKPCSLQIYDKLFKKTLYITNYNNYKGFVTDFNKDYSIDTLDDSLWLVMLTYNGDDKESDLDNLETICLLVQTPLTKYKIYTNSVDSIPDGYFYCRNDKQMKFEYYDYLSEASLNTEEKNNYKIINNSSKDVSIVCNIYDINDETYQKNYVPLKSYKYTISLLQGTTHHLNGDEVIKNESNTIIISETDKKYDGKFLFNLRGVSLLDVDDVNSYNNLYRIDIEVEDELGHVYYLTEDVYFTGQIDGVYDNCISIIPDNISQTFKILLSIPENIFNEGDVYKVIIYKQKMNDPYMTYLTMLDDSDLYDIIDNTVIHKEHPSVIVDYVVVNNNAYKYEAYIEVLTKTLTVKKYLLTCHEYTRPMWRTWSICDLDFYASNDDFSYYSQDNIYQFIPNQKIFTIKNNVNIGDISDNLNIISYNTLGEFGRIMQNKQKFNSGSINFMISDMCEYQKIKDCKNISKIDLTNQNIDDVDTYLNNYENDWLNINNYLLVITGEDSIYYTYNGFKWVKVDTEYSLLSSLKLIDEWKRCVSNGKIKLLKSPDGNMWIVAVSNASSYTVEWKSAQYPTTLSFNWLEVINSNQIIVKKGD